MGFLIFWNLCRSFQYRSWALLGKFKKLPPFDRMGISFSCPFADYDDLEKDFETLVVRSISFKGDELETTLRSVSFNGRDSEPTIMRSLGSGKMIIEGSVSFKRRDSDPFHLETMISIKTPSLPKESALKSASFRGREIADPNPAPNTSMDVIPNFPSLKPSSPTHEAAVTLQKVYKSFRTRRRLADCAVLAEQRWWKLLDFAELKRSSVSFFDIEKPETAFSRWSRARTRAAKVGKGLSKDLKARKLALQHWLEAIDPRHRYGHNLHFYYDSWLHCESRQPFFYWLDVGEGKEVNLVDQCPRTKLQQQCIKYLGPKERETFEVVVKDGKFFYKQDNKLLDTSEGPKNSKWIFVLSTSKNLYVGQKKKGTFQHSSFLAGGATSAAGRLVVENGILKAVWPHSGHYQPTEENFQEFVTFLKEHDVDLTDVKNSPTEEDDDSWSQHGSHHIRSNSSQLDLSPEISNLAIDNTEAKQDLDSEQSHVSENGTYDCCKLKHTDWLEISQTEGQAMSDFSSESQSGKDETVEEESSASEQHYMFHKRNLFEEDHQDGEQEAVPHESILLRINSRKGMKSLQLGKQLSFKWTTGAGPRIGCVRDYPTELQFRALEQVNLSPRTDGNSRAFASPRSTASPRPRTPTASLLKENSSNSNNQC